MCDFFDDMDTLLKVLQVNGLALKYFPSDLKRDRVMALEAVNSNGSALQWVSDDLADDVDIVMAAVQQQGTALQWASDAMRNTKEIVMQAVQQNGAALEWASGTLKHDCDVVMEAVNQNGEFLRWSGRALQDDMKLVKVAVEENPHALEWVSERLQNDKTLVLRAVTHQGSALRWASPSLQRDAKVVLAAVAQNPASLQLSLLRDDFDVVSEAVRGDGACLNYAGQKIQQDPGLKKMAAENSDKFAEKAIKNSMDHGEIDAFFKVNGSALQWAKEFQDDKCRVLEAVKQDGLALEWADEDLQEDEEILKAAVAENGAALRFSRRTDSKDLVEAAIEKNGLALRHAHGLFTGDRDLVLKAVENAGLALRWANPGIKDDEEVVLAAVKREPSALLHASSRLRKNRNFLLKAVRTDKKVLHYVPAIFKDDYKFQLEANLSSSLALAEASKEVHVISTPFNPFQDSKIKSGVATFQPTENLKQRLHNPPEVFCLNPNTDLQAIAHQQGLTEKQQGQLWLKFFTEFLLVAQKKEKSEKEEEKGVVHFVCRKRNEEGCPVLDGNAQQGEWLIASGFGFSDVRQHEYTELESTKQKQNKQYLPQEIAGNTVLLHTGSGIYRTIDYNLKEEGEDNVLPSGLQLYSSPDLAKKTDDFVAWGWTVKCKDLGGGWVEVMDSPIAPAKPDDDNLGGDDERHNDWSKHAVTVTCIGDDGDDAPLAEVTEEVEGAADQASKTEEVS